MRQPSVSDVTSDQIVLFVQALAEKGQGTSSGEREWIKGVIGCEEKIHRADIHRNGRKIARDRIYLERTDPGRERRSINRVNSEWSLKGHIRRRRKERERKDICRENRSRERVKIYT